MTIWNELASVLFLSLVVILILVNISIGWSIASNREACKALGGIYIQSQCIEAKMIDMGQRK